MIKNVNSYLIYLRKSRQDNESETVQEVLERHEVQLQEYAIKEFGQRIPEDNIYREVVSGETIEDRPKIKAMFDRLQKENIKGVLVIEPQRLTRGDLYECGLVVHTFRYSKTLVMTPTKTYDLEDKYDRKFFEMELTRGNDYLEYTKEILMRGRSHSAHEGKWISSVPPYGYDRLKLDKGYSLSINEKEAEIVKLIFHLYVDEGLGAQMICNKINALGAKTRTGGRFLPTSIRQILKNEVYIGKIKWGHKKVVKVMEDGKVVKKRPRNQNYEIIDGLHAPIISDELFKQAQERKGKVTREAVDTSLKNIFAGLIKCKKCGGAIAMRIHRSHGVKTREDRYYCRSGIYCNNKGSNVSIVNEAIINVLKGYLEDFKIKLETNDNSIYENHQKIIISLERELDDIEIRQTQLYDFLEKGIYTPEVFMVRNEKLKEDREAAKEALKNAKQNMPDIKEYEHKYYSLFQALNAIDDPNISAKVKNKLLKEVIEVIYYEKDEADIPHKSRGKVKLEVILK